MKESTIDQRIFNTSRNELPLVTREFKWWTWKRLLVAIVVILVVLEIRTYTFNWKWTGFKANNTVWDWLQLLLLPIALAVVPIWLMAASAIGRSSNCNQSHTVLLALNPVHFQLNV